MPKKQKRFDLTIAKLKEKLNQPLHRECFFNPFVMMGIGLVTLIAGFAMVNASRNGLMNMAKTSLFTGSLQQGGPNFTPPGKLENIKIDKEFRNDEVVELNELKNNEIFGFSINARAELKNVNSVARVILVSGDNEYLVYEGYPAIIGKGIIAVNNFCEETCLLEGVKPDSLKMQIEGGSLFLRSFSYIDSSDGLNSIKTTEIKERKKELKNKQDKFKISKINEKNLQWKAGETTISQYTYQQKKKLFTMGENKELPNLQGFEFYKKGIFEIVPSESAKAKAAAAEKETTNDTVAATTSSATTPTGIPEGWDWRNRHGINWTTPVKNQAYCGSCWAFAAVGSTEILANLYFNNPNIDFDLSEQEITSCSDADGCNGGYPSRALDYIKSTGVTNESCFPYKAIDATGCNYNTCGYEPQLCSNKCSSPTELVKIGGRVNFYSSLGEDELKKWVVEYGGVSGGLYSMSHAMNLVGFKKDTDGSTIWIFKNSWGTGWGEVGFGNIKAPISDFGWTHALLTPVISEKTSKSISCVDQDNDGLCNWGISANKPSSCPSTCSDIKDCDDSNPYLAGFDQNYNCIDLNNMTCSETDGGKDFYLAGQVLGVMDSGESYDSCIDGKNLRETFCNGTTGTSETYVCPDICENGACVTRTCSDSDGGKNYTVKGEITGYMNDNGIKYDHCTQDGKLYEVYCQDNIGYSELHTCSGTCQDGKCIEVSPPTIEITSPANGATITEKFLEVKTSTSSNTSLVEFYIDGALKSTDTSAPFSYKTNANTIGKGTRVIKVVGKTNTSLTASSEITVKIGSDSEPEPDPTITECNDGKDNDGDGKCDFYGCAKNKNFMMPPDPKCSSPDDISESY